MKSNDEMESSDKLFPYGGGKDFMLNSIKNKKENLEMYQSHSHKMKALFTNSAGLRSDLNRGEKIINPLWVNFPTRCVRRINDTKDLQKKIAHYSQSDDVMIVRYYQNNCTACNALDKTFEFLCHQSAERLPNLHFYEINKNEQPELAKGLVRFPQVKLLSGGQWTDIDFKPPEAFREDLYKEVELRVKESNASGRPVTALQAEEMYFSAAGPSMLQILEENINTVYCKSQVRLHNYWKQVSLRRSWFFKKYIQPKVDQEILDEWSTKSLFGEKVVHGPRPHDEVL